MAWVTKDSVEQYDHTPEPPKEYTKRKRPRTGGTIISSSYWAWWWAILVVAWFIKDTVFQTRPDGRSATSGQYDLPADTVTALQDALTPYCTDLER